MQQQYLGGQKIDRSLEIAEICKKKKERGSDKVYKIYMFRENRYSDGESSITRTGMEEKMKKD